MDSIESHQAQARLEVRTGVSPKLRRVWRIGESRCFPRHCHGAHGAPSQRPHHANHIQLDHIHSILSPLSSTPSHPFSSPTYPPLSLSVPSPSDPLHHGRRALRPIRLKRLDPPIPGTIPQRLDRIRPYRQPRRARSQRVLQRRDFSHGLSRRDAAHPVSVPVPGAGARDQEEAGELGRVQ
jgi:hypothetical protein